MGTCCKVGSMFFSPSSAYVVEKVLGIGSFGEVTQCKNLLTVETVAVKQTRDSSYIEQAMEEAEILRTLKEWNSDKYNIVRWNDAFSWDGCYCLEFEKLDVNLMEYMKKNNGALKLQEIRPILQQLATALKFLQSLKIVHGDLKPENIMLVDGLRKPPRVKVIDFGLAMPIAEVFLGQIIQTLSYRAPEILLGAQFNEIIDVWSLGCIAVEMLIGERLFPAQEEFEMMRRISHTLEIPPNCMLTSSLWAEEYFERDETRRWRSKIPPETNNSHVINSLHDLLVIVPFDQTTGNEIDAELNDRVRFVELVGKMLKIDPDKRITASQIFQDPFLTMSHLQWTFGDTSHFKKCLSFMEPQDSSPANPEPPCAPTAVPPSGVNITDPGLSDSVDKGLNRPGPDSCEPCPRKKKRKWQQQGENSSCRGFNSRWTLQTSTTERSLRNSKAKMRNTKSLDQVKCGTILTLDSEPASKQQLCCQE